jgi:simple sugar transport system permease protein
VQRTRDALRRARDPILGLVTAFLLGAVVIVVTDFDHLALLGSDPTAAIGGALSVVIEGYAAMIAGAIGDPGRILTALQTGQARDVEAALWPLSETLLMATPFVFGGLGLAVAFRAGLFNLGADGQFLIGSLGTAITATFVAGVLPPLLTLPVAVIGGTLAGAAYGFIPGFLKARTGAHEVITTLMLNGISFQLALFIAGAIAMSGPPPGSAAVPRLTDLPTLRVDYGFPASLAVAAAVSVLLFRTTLGFELRATGFSRSAARSAGMRPGRTIVVAMALSGGLVGMGSAFFSLGPAFGLSGGPTYDFGYVAFALALLAGRRPGGVVVAALLYAALNTGAKTMVVATGIPLALLTVIVAFAILFVGSPRLTRSIWRLREPAPTPESAATTPV